MLRADSISVAIAGVQVLREISLDLHPGKTTILVGRNGAGKTTTLRAIMGLVPRLGGTIRLDGTEIGGTPAYERAHQGIGYAPEDRRLVPDFTVEENIVLPGLALNLAREDRARRLEEIYALLPQLHVMRARPGSAVSGGQGKIVALGRALMVATRALLLDEPFQGLAPALALEYAKTLGEVRRQREGLAILVTESTPELLDAVADHTAQIERGEIVVP